MYYVGVGGVVSRGWSGWLADKVDVILVSILDMLYCPKNGKRQF